MLSVTQAEFQTWPVPGGLRSPLRRVPAHRSQFPSRVARVLRGRRPPVVYVMESHAPRAQFIREGGLFASPTLLAFYWTGEPTETASVSHRASSCVHTLPAPSHPGVHTGVLFRALPLHSFPARDTQGWDKVDRHTSVARQL